MFFKNKLSLKYAKSASLEKCILLKVNVKNAIKTKLFKCKMTNNMTNNPWLLTSFQPMTISGPKLSCCITQLFWASILVGGGSVINGAYPVHFLPLGRDEVTITSFSSIHVVRTGLVFYEKKPPSMFEKN